MKSLLVTAFVAASGGAVVAGTWLASGDALLVVIASIVWVLVAGWVVSRLQDS